MAGRQIILIDLLRLIYMLPKGLCCILIRGGVRGMGGDSVNDITNLVFIYV